ncbi:His Kinase A (phospho-acceptor) domain-containing protein [Bradyrhizobium erythrophlei]|jgi:signal transduction histidine kinase|nr:His Kinase A (phospho-acceptor) domain-containing protein [Bradyrhizobium erythrophlei]
MVKRTAVAPEEQPFILSSLPPGRAQRRLALAVVLALLVAFLITEVGPLSTIQLGRIDAFVPAYATAMLVNDSITAVLLFAQFSILRSPALLAISSGYLFTALMLIPWMLTFPGVFAPGGLLGAGLQSTTWIYILWHAGFPVFVIAYGLLKDDPARRLRQGSVGAAILASVATTAAVVCAATFLVTAGDALLPRISLDPVRFSTLWLYYAGCLDLLSVLALIVLWIRRRSVLDLWLMVVMCAYVIEITLIAFPVPARFSFGWYAGRIFGFLSGSLLLFVLLYEITTLYAGVLRAVLAQGREREARLMTGDAVSASIAHEIKQPLTGMITNADAGLRWLERSMPDEAKAAFEQIVADGHRAAAVIESIRAIFKKDSRNRTSLDINQLIGEALALTRGDLQRHRIQVQAELNAQVPQVRGDRIQMQQVLLNLITNAIDSMAAKDGPRVLCVRSEVHDGGTIIVSVADTGTGIGSQDLERLFNPLFTTKPGGMGMGLSISRSIIEAHDGRLWAVPNNPEGAVFQFMLAADGATSAGASRREQPDDLLTSSRL